EAHARAQRHPRTPEGARRARRRPRCGNRRRRRARAPGPARRAAAPDHEHPRATGRAQGRPRRRGEKHVIRQRISLRRAPWGLLTRLLTIVFALVLVYGGVMVALLA